MGQFDARKAEINKMIEALRLENENYTRKIGAKRAQNNRDKIRSLRRELQAIDAQERAGKMVMKPVDGPTGNSSLDTERNGLPTKRVIIPGGPGNRKRVDISSMLS